jgi:Tfp pilus assembly protein FimT
MRNRRSHTPGLTVLELMVVLAILGMSVMLVRGGFRALTKADLVEDANDLAAIMRRASQLAVEHGEMHRVVIRMDPPNPRPKDWWDYGVEVCQGTTTVMRNEALRVDEVQAKEAVERGKQKLETLPSDALAVGDPDEAMKRAIAIAGHHVADRMCVPAQDSITGDSKKRPWVRRVHHGTKLGKVAVQHIDDVQDKGEVAIFFFPNGSAEKAVIEVTDGDDTYSVLVHGLTGRVELKDKVLPDLDDHMMRNAMGDKDEKRENE